MSGLARATLAAAAALVSAGVLGGCTHSSAAFPYDRQTVWKVAMAQAVVWHPDVIDEQRRLVRATKTGLARQELELTYELKVRIDPNPFTFRPSTRAYVRIAQRRPKRKRYRLEEEEFLARLAGRLREMAPQRR